MHNSYKGHVDEKGKEWFNVVKKGSEIIPLQELDNITDHRTFGEKEDEENSQRDYIYKILDDYRFDTPKHARNFVGKCMLYTLKKLGAGKIIGKTFSTRAEYENQLYADHKIRIAVHTKDQKDEYWQAGTYIYYEKELIAFIGRAERVECEFIIAPAFYLVRTNIKLPGGKGVIPI